LAITGTSSEYTEHFIGRILTVAAVADWGALKDRLCNPASPFCPLNQAN